MSGLDPRMYGGEALPEALKYEPAESNFMFPGTPDNVPLGEVLEDSQAAREARAQMRHAGRERPGFLAGFGAGIKMTDTAAILEFAQRPSFPPEKGHQNLPFFNELDFEVTPEERDFLDQSQSVDEWKWREQRVRSIREAQAVAGDSPVSSFLGAMLTDVAYLGPFAAAGHLRRAHNASRLAAMTTAGAGGAAIGLSASEGQPMSDKEIMAASLLEFGAASLIRRGGKVVPRDADYPSKELTAAASRLDPNKPALLQPKPEDVVTPEVVAVRVDQVVQEQAKSMGIAERVMWSTAQAFSRLGPVGDRIGRMLVDNNTDFSRTSVESQRRPILNDLTSKFRVFEDELKAALSSEGYGVLSRVFNVGGRAYSRQLEITNQVRDLMLRREQAERQGRVLDEQNVPERVRRMADALADTNRLALEELKAAGVQGAEEISANAGWMRRVWSAPRIEAMRDAIARATGKSVDDSLNEVKRLVQQSLRAAEGFDKTLSWDIANAIVQRALRKSYFEDTQFRTHQGAEATAEIRDVLISSGVRGDRLERALKVLEGRADEAGTPSFLKSRLDLDYDVAVTVGDRQYRVSDLFDPDVMTQTEQYIRGVAGQAALARQGIKGASDIQKMRQELLESIPNERDRGDAAKLFDNVINDMLGRPAGEDLPDAMRAIGQAGRTVALAWSALWQATEFATPLVKYGLVKGTKYMLKEMPVGRQLWGEVSKDPRLGTRLVDILSRGSEQDLRIRPFTRLLEDSFELKPTAGMQLRLQQVEQLVPFANGMRYMHAWQARATANLIVDRFVQATRGDKQAIEMLEKYGLQSGVLEKLKGLGTDTRKWPDGAWEAVRPAFAKMMDEAVLHNRTGDLPAFARYDKLGKFLFTYRTFTLGAHNKLLMGTASRDGLAALSMLVLFQLPLGMLAVQAQAGIKGEGALSMEQAASRAMGIMGSLGLMTEIWQIASGERTQFGAPGIMYIDRLMNLGGNIAEGDAQGSVDAALAATPIIAISPAIRALQNLE